MSSEGRARSVWRRPRSVRGRRHAHLDRPPQAPPPPPEPFAAPAPDVPLAGDDPFLRRSGRHLGLSGRVLALVLGLLGGGGLAIVTIALLRTTAARPFANDFAWAAALVAALAVAVVVWWLARRARLQSAALEAAPQGHAVLSAGGRILFANNQFRALFGAGAQPIDAARGRAADDAGRVALARLEQSAAARVAARSDVAVVVPSGETRWLDVSVHPLGRFADATAWNFEDITERREMAQVLSEEQHKLVDFVENAPVGFYSVDADGRFVFVNHVFSRWLGSDPDTLTSGDRRLHDFVAHALPDTTPAYDPFGTFGSERSGEVTFRTADGGLFQTHITQSVVRAPEDGGLRTRSVVRDLTPEREWEQALRSSEVRFQRVFEDAPVGIAVLDSDQQVTEVNHALAAMVDAKVASLVGQPAAELVAPASRASLLAWLAGSPESQVTDAGHGREVVMAGQARRSANLFARRIEREDGTPGHVLHCLDVTEAKRLYSQFAQAQKMEAVGKLTGGVAHDFNNMLTGIIGFCDLLLLRHNPGDPSFGDIMQIKQTANRAAELVRQLLAFSRQQTLRPQVLDLTDVVTDLAGLLRRLLGAGIDLRVVHARGLGLVKVDKAQMEQVIINLAVNARDAMPDGGVLDIRSAEVRTESPTPFGGDILPPGDYVSVEVSDTGTGIADDVIGHIFEPFYSTKKVGEGTGLGLSSVYGIMKQTGGYIFARSRPPGDAAGRGTTFYLFLPRHAAATASPASPTVDVRLRDLTGSGAILLVEDEDPVRMFAARALRNKGYEVHEAASGEAALSLLDGAAAQIDLLVTDIVMPNMDGASLIQEVRRRRPDLPAIGISGYAEDAFRQKLAPDGLTHFLPKPFNLNDLAAKVKEVMPRR
ncbi:MAG: PAS domain S-box protein [Alphaproteobacteria bacterium]